MTPLSPYLDEAAMAAAAAEGRHRDVIGGRWEELGALQRDFLITRGLRPHHAVLDVGAGAFRAGVRLIPWLDPGRYHALDVSPALLEAGYAREIAPDPALAARFPRANMRATGDFDAAPFGVRFDRAIAQSVFTHLPADWLDRCLDRLAAVMDAGAIFYATVFWAGDGADRPVARNAAVTTYPDRDPYHYPRSVLSRLAARSDWRVEDVGDWGHPVGQQMLAFHRR